MSSSKEISDRSVPKSSITHLEPALWKGLAEATTEDEFSFCWLRLQCRMIPDVLGGMVVVKKGSNSFAALAQWPTGVKGQDHFTPAIEKVLAEKKGVALGLDKDPGAELIAGHKNYLIAFPVKVVDSVHGVAVLEISIAGTEKLSAAMRQLQWGTAWLSNWLHKEETDSVKCVSQRYATVLEITSIALQEQEAMQAATSSITKLATILKCDRVSIGFINNNQSKIFAISHSAQFGKDMNLIRNIESAMDECHDQNQIISYPDKSEDKITIVREHTQLSRQNGALSILSVPFACGPENSSGAITFEWSAPDAFDDSTKMLCDAVTAVLGPILEQKRENDLPLTVKLQKSLRDKISRFLGPQNLALKFSLLILAAVITVLFVVKTEYKVTAKTTLEGEIQQAITVPFEGYIEESFVRAGDLVKKDELLAKLNDKDLRLERLKWASQKAQYEFEYLKAMGAENATDARVAEEQIKQAKVQIWLLEEKLSRASLKAPYDGIVVSGDLSQAQGSPVSTGQILFEIAPLDSYRVLLEVNEKDIKEITKGQKGQLVLNAMPDNPVAISVTKVTPVAIAKEGQTVFRVEAKLENVSPRVRPGMVGYSKIGVTERTLFWIMTHDMVDWLTLKTWSWSL